MNAQQLVELAGQLATAEITADEFLRQAALIENSSAVATVDLDRKRRCGFPEVIYGEGKSLSALIEIAEQLRDADQPVLATRLVAAHGASLARHFGQGVYNPAARTFRMDAGARSQLVGHVAIITAGTCDLPVAEESKETLLWMGVRSTLVPDVGVAGPQRLLERLAEFRTADAIVVVAGMEGALPSVVGGHVPCPVFAVPTSVGYGASLGGLAPLLAMLNSCTSNVAVVNIDAGFRAAYLAGLIATRRNGSARNTGDSSHGLA